ncbi:hypothetical protein QJQ45_021140, partial [Haematococcus lacustris]
QCLKRCTTTDTTIFGQLAIKYYSDAASSDAKAVSTLASSVSWHPKHYRSEDARCGAGEVGRTSSMADFISCLAHAFIAHRKLEHSRARILPSHCPCEPGSEASEQEPSCSHHPPSHPPFRQHLGSAGAVRSRHSLGQAVAGSCQPASGSITVEALIPSRPCSSHSSHNSLAAPGPASCPSSEGPGQSAALGAVVPHLSITETPLSKQHLQTYLRWQKVQRCAVQLGKGLVSQPSITTPNCQALLLRAEHWLEVADDKHRYGSNLRPYFDYYLNLESDGSAEAARIAIANMRLAKVNKRQGQGSGKPASPAPGMEPAHSAAIATATGDADSTAPHQDFHAADASSNSKDGGGEMAGGGLLNSASQPCLTRLPSPPSPSPPQEPPPPLRSASPMNSRPSEVQLLQHDMQPSTAGKQLQQDMQPSSAGKVPQLCSCTSCPGLASLAPCPAHCPCYPQPGWPTEAASGRGHTGQCTLQQLPHASMQAWQPSLLAPGPMPQPDPAVRQSGPITHSFTTAGAALSPAAADLASQPAAPGFSHDPVAAHLSLQPAALASFTQSAPADPVHCRATAESFENPATARPFRRCSTEYQLSTSAPLHRGHRTKIIDLEVVCVEHLNDTCHQPLHASHSACGSSRRCRDVVGESEGECDPGDTDQASDGGAWQNDAFEVDGASAEVAQAVVQLCSQLRGTEHAQMLKSQLLVDVVEGVSLPRDFTFRRGATDPHQLEAQPSGRSRQPSCPRNVATPIACGLAHRVCEGLSAAQAPAVDLPCPPCLSRPAREGGTGSKPSPSQDLNPGPSPPFSTPCHQPPLEAPPWSLTPPETAGVPCCSPPFAAKLPAASPPTALISPWLSAKHCYAAASTPSPTPATATTTAPAPAAREGGPAAAAAAAARGGAPSAAPAPAAREGGPAAAAAAAAAAATAAAAAATATLTAPAPCSARAWGAAVRPSLGRAAAAAPAAPVPLSARAQASGDEEANATAAAAAAKGAPAAGPGSAGLGRLSSGWGSAGLQGSPSVALLTSRDCFFSMDGVPLSMHLHAAYLHMARWLDHGAGREFDLGPLGGPPRGQLESQRVVYLTSQQLSDCLVGVDQRGRLVYHSTARLLHTDSQAAALQAQHLMHLHDAVAAAGHHRTRSEACQGSHGDEGAGKVLGMGPYLHESWPLCSKAAGAAVGEADDGGWAGDRGLKSSHGTWHMAHGCNQEQQQQQQGQKEQQQQDEDKLQPPQQQQGQQEQQEQQQQKQKHDQLQQQEQEEQEADGGQEPSAGLALMQGAGSSVEANTGEEGHKMQKWIYVVDCLGRLYVHAKVRGHFHHSSFLRGGPVLAAGGMLVQHGLLTKLMGDSGHYHPTLTHQQWLIDHLKAQGADLSLLTDISMKHT